MHRKFLSAVLALWAAAAVGTPASACPFCARGSAAGPGQSLGLADATVLTKIVARRRVFSEDGLSEKLLASFEILKLAHGDIVAVGQRVDLFNPVGLLGDSLQAVLMLAKQDGKVVLLDAFPDPDGKLFDYLSAARTLPKFDFAKRIAFYVEHLENARTDIAADAQQQFIEIPYEAVRDNRKTLPVEKLRAWLASADTPTARKGLYGLMLGTAGAAGDEALLRRTLDRVADNATASGGVLAGLCVLTGKAGEVLPAVLKDERRPAACRIGVLQVARFLWDQTPADRRAAEVLPIFGLAMQYRDTAPAAVTELALLNEFSLTEQVKAYWADAKRLTPRGRTAVFLYQKSLPKEQRDDFRKWMSANAVTIDEKD